MHAAENASDSAATDVVTRKRANLARKLRYGSDVRCKKTAKRRTGARVEMAKRPGKVEMANHEASLGDQPADTM